MKTKDHQYGCRKNTSPDIRYPVKKSFHETCIWLRTLLMEDKMFRVEDVKKAASADGCCWNTVKRAKRFIGVETIHQQADFDCDEAWFWYYPFVM